MSLYKIMLVDDEEEVRKSIIKKIDWADAGFEVVGDAENGQEALEKLELLEPDVVVTDIRMPYMDGLALTEKIRQRYPSTKVVIFSGFDDFEYAQRAIQLNVTEYILKPVNVEEMTAILKKIRRNLDEEIAMRRDVDLLRERYVASLPLMREHFLNTLVTGSVAAETAEEKLKEYEVDILGASKWVVAVIHVEPGEDHGSGTSSLHQEQELIPISVKQLMEEKLKPYCRFVIFNSFREMVLIAAIDETNTQTGFIELLNDICKECRKVLEVAVTAGVGVSSPSLDRMGRSYQTAVDALGYRAIVGEGGVIYINDVEPVNRGKLQLDQKEESDLVAAIKFGPREKIEAAARAIAGRMDAKVHILQYQAYILSVASTVIQLVQQYDLNLSEILGTDRDYFEVLAQMDKREDFYNWLIRVACRIGDALGQERDNTAKNMIREAKQYIEENYSDPELSVEKICRHLHMSPAYFSTMFKKETGQTYIAYLTEVRLNRAVELLNKTDDKTYIIASKVGYQEQNYFSYVFKKRFGVSPTKYRGAK